MINSTKNSMVPQAKRHGEHHQGMDERAQDQI